MVRLTAYLWRYKFHIISEINIIILVIQCNALSDPDNGAVSFTGIGVNVGDTATYSCNDGYELSDDSTLICQSDGEWSSPPPTCEGTIALAMALVYTDICKSQKYFPKELHACMHHWTE